jgi:hypothetical protein
MTKKQRLIALAIVAVIHIGAFAPTIGSASSILDRGFWPQSERILDGQLPYREVNFEYPPLALPLVIGPALVSDGPGGYEYAFEIQMLLVDLALVALLALAVPGSARRVVEALGVYTLALIAVSGVVLWDSAIESGPLALARFDLVPAGLILAALLAREARRSALWGVLLGAATAVKAFPAVLAPAMLRGEKAPLRALAAAAIPLVIAAAIVIVWGDEFGSAISYHSNRDLQIETLGATPLLLAHQLFGAGASVTTGAGAFNLSASGAGAARTISIALTIALVLFLLYECWVRRTPAMVEATAILTVIIVFAPVLSPQFLLWVLPVSAVVYGAGRENAALLACFVLTELLLHNYIGVQDLESGFVWSVAARNAALLVYLVLVVIPIFKPARTLKT